MLRTTAGESTQSCIASEVPRLQGELLMRLEQPDPAEAERCLREAIGLARERQSRSLELRAATSLARLLSGSGRKQEARGVLTEIYASFTEGFDTADLKSARAVLDGL